MPRVLTCAYSTPRISYDGLKTVICACTGGPTTGMSAVLTVVYGGVGTRGGAVRWVLGEGYTGYPARTLRLVLPGPNQYQIQALPCPQGTPASPGGLRTPWLPHPQLVPLQANKGEIQGIIS